MIKNLQMFNPNGTILAYKNPASKRNSLVNYVVSTCLAQGRLTNGKLAVISTCETALKFAKACKARNIDFRPVLINEDANVVAELQGLGFSPEITAFEQRNQKMSELQSLGWYWFDQFSDDLMVDYCKSEASKALTELNGTMPDLYVGFVETGATLRGFYETLKGICPCAYTNSYLQDESKLNSKVFVRDIIRNGQMQFLPVQPEQAKLLKEQYEQSGQSTPVQRCFFGNLEVALTWLQSNPGKTVLLYWED